MARRLATLRTGTPEIRLAETLKSLNLSPKPTHRVCTWGLGQMNVDVGRGGPPVGGSGTAPAGPGPSAGVGAEDGVASVKIDANACVSKLLQHYQQQRCRGVSISASPG